MKKCMLMMLGVLVLLTGCAAAETFETVMDVIVPQTPVLREVSVELPEDAVVSVMESSAGKLYLCDSYEITLQTFSAGSLSQTVRSVSGYDGEELTILESAAGEGVTRYDFVWSAMGENGERIGRAAILDDGGYHYVLSAMADAADAGELTEAWNSLLRSFQLESY